MKKMFISLLLAAGIQGVFAQEDTTIVPQKSKTVSEDTIKVGTIIIIKRGGQDSTSYDVYKNNESYRKRYYSENITTNWFVVDLGYAGFDDRTNYATQEAQDFLRNQQGVPASKGDYSIKGAQISNFNLWFFMQRLNLYKHVVNLKYGFGIENLNYYYKTPITYIDGANPYTIRDTISFSKNKIATDFFTIPLMVNINTMPHKRHGGIQLSFGVSAGYMYSSRQKQKSSERGKQKQKTDFNLERWKLAYVAELGLGIVRVYGSYSMTPMHRYGLEQYPWTVGLRFSAW